jgi:hypothetical protein
LVETSTVILPITQKRLWNGIIVHPNENGGDVYPVLIDADQRIILNGLNFNPQTYWEEAESSFRQANQELILIYLKALGYEPRYVASVNVIDARMTKRDILRLSQAPLDSLGSIHYSGQIPQP